MTIILDWIFDRSNKSETAYDAGGNKLFSWVFARLWRVHFAKNELGWIDFNYTLIWNCLLLHSTDPFISNDWRDLNWNIDSINFWFFCQWCSFLFPEDTGHLDYTEAYRETPLSQKNKDLGLLIGWIPSGWGFEDLMHFVLRWR